jgi:hypothetical protein
MRHTLWCVALAVLGAVALVQAAGPTTAPATKPTTQPVAVNKFCAVQGEGHAIDPKVTLVHDGKVIGFCCTDCIGEFKKDPAKYMASLK